MTKSILDAAVELREFRAEERANSKYTPKKFGCGMSDNDVVLYNIQMESKRVGYIEGATEQKELDDKRIAELEKEKASLMLEIHNKNKRIAELIAR